MDDSLNRAKIDLSKLIKLQNKDVLNYFASNSEEISERLLITAANIHGIIEQIESLNCLLNSSENEKLEFVTDNSELDISENELEMLCENKNLSYFSSKYNAAIVLKNHPVAYDHFLKQTEYFINSINELRTALQVNDYTLTELVILKSTIIKCLCTLEFLINKML
jgi:hypothetical protein